MSRLTLQEWIKQMESSIGADELANYMFREEIAKGIIKPDYKDLEEQGRLIDWKRTSEEKPGSTRHVIVADGAIISHYGYYLKPKDKWFTDWTCEKEIDAPMLWADMPEPPKESLHSDCGAKMDEVENER